LCFPVRETAQLGSSVKTSWGALISSADLVGWGWGKGGDQQSQSSSGDIVCGPTWVKRDELINEEGRDGAPYIKVKRVVTFEQDAN